VDAEEARHEYGITPIERLESGKYDAIILAVAHREFIEMGLDRIRSYAKTASILYDVKYLFPASQTDGRL